MRIALGTVQFGVPYGVANSDGQVTKKKVKSILKYAQKFGIDTLDTAISYGDSEKILGEGGVDGFNVITKLPEVPDGCKNLSFWVENQINESLKRLRIKKLSGVFLHRPCQLLDDNKCELWPILVRLKDKGLVESIGFSIYDPNELDQLYNFFLPVLVQAPFNVLDKRLEESGWLQRLYDDDVEVHVRSIFLQGLLLMNKFDRPIKFNKWALIWDDWDKWVQENNVSPIQAAISFSLSDSRISKVVVGVDSLSHLKDIIAAAQKNFDQFPKNLGINDVRLLNPSNWSSL